MLLQSVSYCDDSLINFISTPCLQLLPGNGMREWKKILTTILVLTFQPAAS